MSDIFDQIKRHSTMQTLREQEADLAAQYATGQRMHRQTGQTGMAAWLESWIRGRITGELRQRFAGLMRGRNTGVELRLVHDKARRQTDVIGVLRLEVGFSISVTDEALLRGGMEQEVLRAALDREVVKLGQHLADTILANTILANAGTAAPVQPGVLQVREPSSGADDRKLRELLEQDPIPPMPFETQE